MKQIKTWKYIGLLYASTVTFNVISLLLQVWQGDRLIPFGLATELTVEIFKAILDLIIIVPLGYIVDLILSKFMKESLFYNVLVTVFLYEIIATIVRNL